MTRRVAIYSFTSFMVLAAGGLGWRVFMDASKLAAYLADVRAG